MTDAGHWIRRLAGPVAGDDRRLLCFPHAGGSVPAFRPLAKALDGEVEVAAVQYPGRQDRLNEDVVTDLHVLADRIACVLGAEGRVGPELFIGHSMGALVAYEVACRLRGSNAPSVLFVAGRGAPAVAPRFPVPDDDEGIIDLLGLLGGTDAGLLDDADLRELVLPAVRGDYRAVRDYHVRPCPPLTCPLVALTGTDDPVCREDDVRGWADCTTSTFDVMAIPGGHFFVHDDVRSTAAVVRTHLGTGRLV